MTFNHVNCIDALNPAQDAVLFCKLQKGPFKGRYIGVDGCKGGWIAAVIEDGELRINRYDRIETLVEEYSDFDSFLIDMAVGLPESKEDIRPEEAARKLLKGRSSTVFNVPSRQAVMQEIEELQKQTNIKILGKSLSKQSAAIIPKIREVDEFMMTHKQYQNRICESHPELCFARVNGGTPLGKKNGRPGFDERGSLLSQYIDFDLQKIWIRAKELGCKPDDAMDALCLAVVAGLKAQGLCETIPADPKEDARGLLMQMIVPKTDLRFEST